jgi:superfamily II DNA/RNA helicase
MARILQATGRGHTLVFCRTKRHAQKLADDLASRGFAVGAVHGDLGQGAREQAMRAFRNGKVDVLVATDVAARGIDVEGITHVVNYSCPEDEKTYVHRIGRTARAGASGVAITFVDWDDLPRWSLINKALGLTFDQPVETYSTSEHLFAELSIPQQAGPRLPRDKRTLAGLDAEVLEDLGETGRKPRSGDRKGSSGAGRSSSSSSQSSARPSSRDRTRTRGGRPSASTAPSSDSTGTATDAPAAPRRRRRRRRGGSGTATTTETG